MRQNRQRATIVLPLSSIKTFIAKRSLCMHAALTSEDSLRRELEHHLELLDADYQRSGLPAREARRRALIAFGGLEQVKEACRDTRWYTGLVRASRVLLAAAQGR
jgi:formate-dependent phosphoribosylglycinamide formyltransferase (GAR transformylase)